MSAPRAPGARFTARHATLCVLALAALAAAFVVVRSTPFALNGDNLTLTHPLLVDSARQLRAGELPIWTTGRWGGSPLLGDPVAGALYPGHLVGYLATSFPHRHALDVDVACDVAWLALGALWWLGAIGASPFAAAIGTILLVSNPSVALMARGWIQYLAAFAWWPWLFGAAVWLARRPSIGCGLLAASALAAQVYAGYPEFALQSGAAALAWVALRPGSAATRSPAAIGLGLATATAIGLGALGLAAAQILPGVAMARESIRAGAEGASLSAGMHMLALGPAQWRDVFLPAPMNNLAAHRIAPAVGLLATLGVARGGAGGRLLGAIALVAALLSARALPFADALSSLPPLRFFPMPAKFFYLFLFCATSLAALGIDGARRLSPAWRRALLVVLAASASPALAAAMPHLWLAIVALAVGTSLLPARWFGCALAALAMLAALATFAGTAPLRAPFAFGPGGFRRLLEVEPPERFGDRPAARALALADDGDVHQLGANYGSLWGIGSWNGVGPLAQRRQLEVLERLTRATAVPVARELGASPVIVAAGGALEANLIDAGFTGPPPEAWLRSLFAPSIAPHYALFPDVRLVDASAARAAARSGQALEPGGALIEALAGVDREGAAPPGDPSGKLEVVSSAPTSAELSVAVDRPTWLVAREPYYQNWCAAIDGAPVAIRPAGGLFLGVPVPAGRHRVVLEYDEPGFRRGLALGGLTLVLLPLALAALARLERRVRPASAPPQGETGAPSSAKS